MSLSQSASNKITSLATAITNLITTHYNLTGSSQQKGHVQAGSTPQAIGDSLAAGTDNGFYARADHVHSASTAHVKDTNAYANLGTNTNASQQAINQAINSKIGDAIDYINR